MRSLVPLFFAIALAGSMSAQDFSAQTTPTCGLAGLVARPPAGWFNVPIQGAPRGHVGCQMMRTNEAEELVGILRVRSVTAPAREYSTETDTGLIANERKAIGRMNVEVAEEPLWTRDNVPLRGEGFRDAHGAGYAATIEGGGAPQEVHFLTFRGKDAIYLITLITPAKGAAAEIWKRNTDDFGVLIRSLTASP